MSLGAMRRGSAWTFLGLVLLTGVCSACVPVECLNYNMTNMTQKGPEDPCEMCLNNNTCYDAPTDVPKCCLKVFRVEVNSSSGFDNLKGDDVITMDCVHDLPLIDRLVFGWQKNGVTLNEKDQSNMTLKLVFSARGKYSCSVLSRCGKFISDQQEITFLDHPELLLLICGVVAVVFLLAFGIVIKITMKRNFAKTQLRRQQQNAQIHRVAPQIKPRET